MPAALPSAASPEQLWPQNRSLGPWPHIFVLLPGPLPGFSSRPSDE
jgi:hypothetical protein